MDAALNYLKDANLMLKNFDEETDFVGICKNIYKNCKNYSNINELNNCIIELRRLLKFQEKIFEAEFNIIFVKFKNFIKNENEQILENILILFNEILDSKNKFGCFIQEWFNELISDIIRVYYYKNSNERIKLLIEVFLTKINEDENTVNCYINVFENMNEIILVKPAIINFFNYIKKFERLKVINKFNWKRIFESMRYKNKEFSTFFYNEFINAFNKNIDLFKIIFINVNTGDYMKFKQMTGIEFQTI
jgi:hypothetical protein